MHMAWEMCGWPDRHLGDSERIGMPRKTPGELNGLREGRDP